MTEVRTHPSPPAGKLDPRARRRGLEAWSQMLIGKRLGIDLGTAHIRIAIPHEGIKTDQPSVVALDPRENAVIAAGGDAARMIGRAPETIQIVHPMREGVIDDYLIVEALLRYYISDLGGRWNLVRPEVMVATPAGVTNVEQRAVRDAAEQAGARRPAHLIANPLAAAIGAGLPMGDAQGSLVVDLGAGRSEAAVLSMYGVVVWESARVGGDVIRTAIADYVRRRHNLLIGDTTADDLKHSIGSAEPLERSLRTQVRGRDAATGMPRTVALTSNELTPSIQSVLETIVEVIRTTLERTPPELTADVIDRGLMLTGGGAMLRELDKYLSRQTGIPVHIADQPRTAVAMGAAFALENLDLLRPNLITPEGALTGDGRF